jgi:hypothetical protein
MIVMRNGFLLATTLLAIVFAWSIAAQADTVGEKDKCEVLLKETAKPNHWMVEINLTNDEPLFGMVFPLRIWSTKGQLTYDSTSFVGSRIEDFAVKIPFEDTTHYKDKTGLMINLGLIGSVGPDATELKPGSGMIARHFISGDKSVSTESIQVDSTFIYPSNRLMGTMIDAKTSIKPDFEFKKGGK